MSSTNKTKNYDLSQFEPTDTPSWLNDYNSDMAKIDEAIHEAAESGVSDVAVETEDGKATISVTKDGEATASEISTITQAQSEKLDGLADIKKVGANLTLEEDGTLNAEDGTVDFNGLDNRPKYNGAAMTGSTDIPDLSGQVSENTGKIATNASEIAAVNTLIKSTQSNLTTEVTNRENADKAIQSQIDALVSKTDVVDIVGTYEQLQAYDTSTLGSRDVIEVLSDVNHNNALSYYRWNDPTEDEWNWIGSISPYYSKSQADSIFVPMTRTINGQSLAENIIIELPTKTSQLTNDSGFITNAALTNLVPNTRTVNGKALSEDILLPIPEIKQGLFIYGPREYIPISNERVKIIDAPSIQNDIIFIYKIGFRIIEANTIPIALNFYLYRNNSQYGNCKFIIPTGLPLNTTIGLNGIGTPPDALEASEFSVFKESGDGQISLWGAQCQLSSIRVNKTN